MEESGHAHGGRPVHQQGQVGCELHMLVGAPDQRLPHAQNDRLDAAWQATQGERMQEHTLAAQRIVCAPAQTAIGAARRAHRSKSVCTDVSSHRSRAMNATPAGKTQLLGNAGAGDDSRDSTGLLRERSGRCRSWAHKLLEECGCQR